MSQSTSHKFYLVEETEYGVTPASAQFVEVPITGTTLGLTKNTSQSNTIRSDRQISDFRDGTQQIGGDIKAELQWQAIDMLLAAAVCGNWESNKLKSGTQRRSFSILRHFTTLSAADKPYQLYRGIELNNINIQLGTEGVTTATFSAVGKSVEALSELPAGASLTATPAAPAVDTFNGQVMEGGENLAIATELGFTLENGIEPRFVIGSSETIRPSIGLSNLTGTLGVYFENHALLEKFFSGEKSNIGFSMADPEGNEYIVTVPNLKYTGGQPDVEGTGAIIVSLPFQGLLSEAEGTNLIIERRAKA
ncbi:phage tail tube protein [Pseudoalteromonas sp. T1lg65]|uniref:phage tail tube protein n=1 Tax=Pseudoalteromonas sp. T1lg65 TaxID=2077101 RepID=UPI003F7A3C1A